MPEMTGEELARAFRRRRSDACLNRRRWFADSLGTSMHAAGSLRRADHLVQVVQVVHREHATHRDGRGSTAAATTRSARRGAMRKIVSRYVTLF